MNDTVKRGDNPERGCRGFFPHITLGLLFTVALEMPMLCTYPKRTCYQGASASLVGPPPHNQPPRLRHHHIVGPARLTRLPLFTAAPLFPRDCLHKSHHFHNKQP
jgi:hypothetical protein